MRQGGMDMQDPITEIHAPKGGLGTEIQSDLNWH